MPINFLGDPLDYPEVEDVGHIGPPARRDPMDPAPLLLLFQRFHKEIDRMADESRDIVVTDDAALETATTYTTQAKALAQAIEKKRVELKAPYLAVISVLDAETKSLKDRTGMIQSGINDKIRPYLEKKEMERREAERRAREEAIRMQCELDEKYRLEREQSAEAARQAAEAAGLSKQQAEQEAKAAAAMVEDAPVVVAQVQVATKVETESGSARLKEDWTFEITDIRAIPPLAFASRKAELIKALSPWVNAQVKAGVREIPGVRIFKQAKIETRTKKRV